MRGGIDAGYQLGILKDKYRLGNENFVDTSHGASASLIGGARVPITRSWSGFLDLAVLRLVYTTGGFDVVGGWLARTTVGTSYGW